jgi:hypothetical protein
MEKDLEHLLTNLYANKITDTDEFKDKLESFLHPRYSASRFSSYLILRCINSEIGLISFLESAITKKDKLTKNLKKIITLFLARLVRVRSDYIKNHIGPLLVS